MSAAIDALIPRGKLNELLSVLSDCLELPVQLLDEKGAQLEQYGCETGYCALLKRDVFRAGECAAIHLKAGQHAQVLGESYIFSCHANLNHIAFPLLSHGALLGSIIVGPFLMDEPDSTLITDLAEHYALSPTLSPRARWADQPADRPPAYAPSALRAHAAAGKAGKAVPAIPHKRNNPDVQGLRRPFRDRSLPLRQGAGVAGEGKNRTDVIKSRALELTTLLSRVAIEGGAQAGSIYRLNHQFLSRLRELDGYEDLCYQLQEIVESFVSAVSLPDTQSGSSAIRAAVRHIARHYAEPLTLAQLAETAGLSPSYFSALFVKVMGVSLREYINHVRVEEAKRLLTATDYPLSQIAVSVGFSDQSYFSKVFKQITGISPNRYR